MGPVTGVQDELFSEGLTLMLAGMGTVFVFLTLLVIAMTLLSRLVAAVSPAGSSDAGDEEIAAISAAIQEHRKR